jgi:hypothetical protein
MHDEDGKDFAKYFAYLNLFVFSMLLLVMGGNYLVMFIGWEGVGLCSYLLIGYWFKNVDYTNAAKKAFIMNRIGDLGFLLALFWLISKIGRESMVKTRDSLHYGKGVMSADSTKYWTNGSLLITPDEQLGFIKKLYFNELPFQKRSQDMYKKMIVREDNANYKLSYIDGLDSAKGQNWFLGYVEENKHPYFFVFYTQAIKSTPVINDHGALLKTILLQQGFLKGVR